MAETPPDAEAMITNLEKAYSAVPECFENGSDDEQHEAMVDLDSAREALRTALVAGAKAVEEAARWKSRYHEVETLRQAAEVECAALKADNERKDAALTTLEREACIAANLILDDDKIGRGIQHLRLLHPAIDKARAALAKKEHTT